MLNPETEHKTIIKDPDQISGETIETHALHYKSGEQSFVNVFPCKHDYSVRV